MLLLSDVHGAFDDLARVASSGEPLVIIGDLLNFIDYRTMDGLMTEVAGIGITTAIVSLRAQGDHDGAREVWRSFTDGREDEVQGWFRSRMEDEYGRMAEAIDGAEVYITYGNVDRPDLLVASLPSSARFVDGEVIEIGGTRVGIVGGGVPRLGVVGEVAESEMAAKLAAVSEVDVLCTHVAPAVRQLSHDVIAGMSKESHAVLAHVQATSPPWHYFGDIHQPQATTWRIGQTQSRNVGYFRATGRAVRHSE